MKKMFLVLLIIAIAMIGIVSAAISTIPVGESGFYDITSSPSGASATVDGTAVGTTPTTATVIVGVQGIQSPSIKRDSSLGASNVEAPTAGQHVAVNAVLVAIPTPTPTPAPGSQKGYYKVSSDPTGGSVLFDGTNYGITPVTITVNTTGTPDHTITVSKSAYQTWSQFYSGKCCSDQTVNVFRHPQPGCTDR